MRGMMIVLAMAWVGCERMQEPACSDERECEGALVCADGECVACQADRECGDRVCVVGQCVDACAATAECEAGDVCIDRRCQEGLMASLAIEGNYQNFLAFSREAGLYEELSTSAVLTLFVPVDEAIERLPVECLVALQLDLDAMRSFLRMHIGLGLGRLDPDGLRLSAAAGDELPVATLESLTAGLDDAGRVTIEGLPLRGGHLQAPNGFAYPVLDGVFLPRAGLPAACDGAF